MDTLLNQLKEQDLELYQEIVADLLPSSDHRNNFIICGKLQEAIRARGWAYQVSCTFQGTRFAKIATINPDGSKWFHDDQHAPTEAEALMRAYLSALSGERI